MNDPLLFFKKQEIEAQEKIIMKQFQEEEPDQRSQQNHEECVVRNEKKRFIAVCLSLIAIILAYVLFLLTNSVLAVFFSIVLTFLCYQRLEPRKKHLKYVFKPRNGERPRLRISATEGPLYVD
jgi:Flp pilus assembly protein TadB